LLRGYRGRPVGDLDALARLVASVSQLAAFDEIAEAEINPVLVQADGVVRLDALIRLGEENGAQHG
jgi:succinyl-CoA synthetase beta subunit